MLGCIFTMDVNLHKVSFLVNLSSWLRLCLHMHTLFPYSKDFYGSMDGLGESVCSTACITQWMHVHQLDDQ